MIYTSINVRLCCVIVESRRNKQKMFMYSERHRRSLLLPSNLISLRRRELRIKRFVVCLFIRLFGRRFVDASFKFFVRVSFTDSTQYFDEGLVIRCFKTVKGVLLHRRLYRKLFSALQRSHPEACSTRLQEHVH